MPEISADKAFTTSEVSFAIGKRTLIGPVTLQLERGRVYGLIGHNGSGKSTLMKLLARQQVPSSGSIVFAGRPLSDWRAREFARVLAYLPQTTPAATGLTVRELAALGRYPWHGALGRFSADDRRHVDEALALTDMVGFADRLVDELSGGERQRAWIAMLVAHAGVMLLDEPISALDIAHQEEVLGLVRQLSQKRGLCVVTVLHDPNMAARHCDELIALKEGILLTQGKRSLCPLDFRPARPDLTMRRWRPIWTESCAWQETAKWTSSWTSQVEAMAVGLK